MKSMVFYRSAKTKHQSFNKPCLSIQEKKKSHVHTTVFVVLTASAEMLC